MDSSGDGCGWWMDRVEWVDAGDGCGWRSTRPEPDPFTSLIPTPCSRAQLPSSDSIRQDENTNVMTQAFMVHRRSTYILRTYPHVVGMDATYKTNKYNMHFLELIGITPCNKYIMIGYVLMVLGGGKRWRRVGSGEHSRESLISSKDLLKSWWFLVFFTESTLVPSFCLQCSWYDQGTKSACPFMPQKNMTSLYLSHLTKVSHVL